MSIARNRRFLEYVVEETLAGRAERLKEYTIATTVFGRAESFDPGLDPVVRMEARRIRRALERFYLIEGEAGGSVRIGMPSGGYVPDFQRSGPDKAARSGDGSDARSVDPGEMPIIVGAFNGSGDSKALLGFNRGFARHVMIALHKLGHSVASGLDPVVEGGADGKANGGARRAVRVLTGDMAVLGDSMSVTALLMEQATGKVLWGSSFQHDLAQGIVTARDKVADLLAHELHTHLSRSSRENFMGGA